jgi:methylmalonyl-CoA mutase C-terminal domain/subunit
MVKENLIKVLIAKPGLDGHDRGAKVLTLGLREKGFEVIYTGLGQTPEQIVERAQNEKVDVIGLSSLSGAHKSLFPEVVRLSEERGMKKVLIIGGGLIPAEDESFLRESGVKAIFGPGTRIDEIADFIKNNVKQ